MKIPFTLHPRTYADVLTLAQASHVLFWDRRNRTLALTFDDYTADRRTCATVSLSRGKCGTVEIRTLSGYDPAKHRWGDYCSPQGTIGLPDRRGLKALMDWLSEQAAIQTRCPNPESFSIYRPPITPTLASP